MNVIKPFMALMFILFVACHNKSTDQIMISGRIEAEEVNLAFKYPGKIVQMDIFEGSEVLPGVIVAKIKADEMISQLNRSKIDYTSTATMRESKLIQLKGMRDKLEQLINKKKIAEEAIDNEIKIAQNNVLSAEQKLKIDKITSEKVQINLSKIENDYSRFKSLYEQHAIPKQKYEEIENLYKITKRDLDLANENVKISEQQLETAKNSLDIAFSKRKEIDILDKEIAFLNKNIEILKKELIIADLNMDKSKELINEVQSHIEDTVIRPQTKLIITKKFSQLGEVVAAGQPIAVGYNPEEIHFRGFISEVQLGRIKLNSEGYLKIDSFPDKKFKGRITYISNRAEFTPKEVQTQQERVKQVFLIKAKIIDDEKILKPGMPADFIINEK
ncbi:MAG: HlyD family efflux transporter periplasmic adaptor subunit [Calditerrivibrio sp.]|nr:HlyD family efflux transporter periplasmic adaptor subunit [Calditerrivibrio sp.]